jgi:L-alanine-DL-glutamate epimerase-like enolase superfamily enzyme
VIASKGWHFANFSEEELSAALEPLFARVAVIMTDNIVSVVCLFCMLSAQSFTLLITRPHRHTLDSPGAAELASTPKSRGGRLIQLPQSPGWMESQSEAGEILKI